MRKIILGLTLAAAATLAAGAASAQTYRYDGRDGYRGGYQQDYRYNRVVRDSDRDGIPDRAEWNIDRDRDGRLDQYDRYDNRRQRHNRHQGWDRRDHDRNDNYTRYDGWRDDNYRYDR